MYNFLDFIKEDKIPVKSKPVYEEANVETEDDMFVEVPTVIPFHNDACINAFFYSINIAIIER